MLEVTEPFWRKPGLTRQWSNSGGLYILSVVTQKAVLSSLAQNNHYWIQLINIGREKAQQSSYMMLEESRDGARSAIVPR